ncbi:MAG: GAF domain-containing protein [Bacteroides sp.]|nr:GAF domain-containing protein [Bacteroides sp.]
MEQSFKQSQSGLSKEEKYKAFIEQYKLLIEGETNKMGILANTTAAIKEAFGFFWIGFYLVEGDNLLLGPFQGSVACYKIKKGKGVCGTSWDKEQTIVVPDVDKFEGHIACSSLSKSEIVVPLFVDNKVIAVLDIDSDELNTFCDIDKKYLEQTMNILSQTLKNI